MIAPAQPLNPDGVKISFGSEMISRIKGEYFSFDLIGIIAIVNRTPTSFRTDKFRKGNY
jgi:hypothetical protein